MKLSRWAEGRKRCSSRESGAGRDARTLLQAANERLEWLREDYGEDDVDLLTFGPVVALAERLLADALGRA